jgi:hypothetical protein
MNFLRTDLSSTFDGSIARLHYPGGHYIRRDYTARGQLAAVGWDDDENSWWMKLAAYTYLSERKQKGEAEGVSL